VWEVPYYPTYYLPVEDVSAGLVATGATLPGSGTASRSATPSGSGISSGSAPQHSPSRGTATVYDVVAGPVTASGAAVRYLDSPIEQLRETVRLDWDAMSEWLEEDEPVYTHPRSPYTRVDILASSRHVRVELDGVVLAESRSPRILFETGLPPRYYLPIVDVRRGLLRPSGKLTRCPYKGTAAYWSVEVNGTTHEDLVWTYRTPLPESQKIAGLLCFYDERVDLIVDGVRQDPPRTQFA
jgi:uncharacterized protein (DUF427 family)